MGIEEVSLSLDTTPKLLRQNYLKYGSKKVAIRKKDFGIWKRISWDELYENVKYLSLGLVSLGFRRGDKISILGDNEPEWFMAEYAAQAVGGVAVGVYTEYLSPEVKYVVNHSESCFVFVKDQEQVDKLLAIRDEIPLVKKVIYWDAKGLRGYDDPILMDFENLLALGKDYHEKYPQFFDTSIDEGKGDDIALISYTSGTTSDLPKGAIITYDCLILLMRDWLAVFPLTEADNYVSFLTLGWIGDQLLAVCASLLSGAMVNCSEKPETTEIDIREIAPQAIFYSSAVWENVVRGILVKIGEADWIKRGLFNLFLPLGYKVANSRITGGKPSLFWRILYTLGRVLVFRPLLDKLGLINGRHIYTGGAPLGPDAFKFLRAIGVNIKQLYGSTEAGISCVHRDNAIRMDSVGQPLPIGEWRVNKEGELLYRGKNLFKGYWKAPEETAKSLRQGWFYTGDAGYFTDDGHLIFLDRVKDLSKLANHIEYAPQFIESKLKFSKYIKDAVVLGDIDKEYISALIIIDFQNVGKWAEKGNIGYTTFVDLSQRAEVYDLITKQVEKINKELPKQIDIRKFVLLHKELDPDDAELTRTRKLRRGYTEKHYRNLIDAIYKDMSQIEVETEVKYRDGRKGHISAAIKVQELEING